MNFTKKYKKHWHEMSGFDIICLTTFSVAETNIWNARNINHGTLKNE